MAWRLLLTNRRDTSHCYNEIHSIWFTRWRKIRRVTLLNDGCRRLPRRLARDDQLLGKEKANLEVARPLRLAPRLPFVRPAVLRGSLVPWQQVCRATRPLIRLLRGNFPIYETQIPVSELDIQAVWTLLHNFGSPNNHFIAILVVIKSPRIRMRYSPYQPFRIVN